MKNKILKQSQLLGLKTFGWEMKLRVKGLYNPLYKPLGFIIGWINNFQMVIHNILMKFLK